MSDLNAKLRRDAEEALEESRAEVARLEAALREEHERFLAACEMLTETEQREAKAEAALATLRGEAIQAAEEIEQYYSAVLPQRVFALAARLRRAAAGEGT